jgi:hypothetical protein
VLKDETVIPIRPIRLKHKEALNASTVACAIPLYIFDSTARFESSPTAQGPLLRSGGRRETPDFGGLRSFIANEIVAVARLDR